MVAPVLLLVFLRGTVPVIEEQFGHNRYYILRSCVAPSLNDDIYFEKV